MRLFIKEWQKITDNPFVLKCITGYKLHFNRPVTQNPVPITNILVNEQDRYRDAIGLSIQKGAVETCTPCHDQFLSTYFLAPKPHGSYRFILNLRHLNEFIDAPHFKMEDIRMARNLVFSNYYMASLDLSDAFYLVPVHKSCRKFLRFEFLGILY